MNTDALIKVLDEFIAERDRLRDELSEMTYDRDDLRRRVAELEAEVSGRDAVTVPTRSVNVHVVERTRPPAKLHLTPDEWEDIANS